MRKILMLDFDGVLHPSQGTAVPDFAWASRVANVLAEHPCEVVISSTWREHYSLEQLQALLPETISKLVVGVLGADCPPPWGRYKTILAWVSERAPGTSWRALDDTAAEFPPECPELIHCPHGAGLDKPAEAKLRSWLAYAA
jgi:hypothetical protein